MPFYSPLRHWDIEARNRAIAGIRAIRAQKERDLPQRTLKNTLLLATWNIRDFGNEDKRAEGGLNQPGPRLEESYYYIAEVMSAELGRKVSPTEALDHLMRILGPSWEYMTTDVAPGKAGNEERMTFIYDKSKVRFKHVAGQIVTDTQRQLVRPPYYAAFQSGWFKFSLCTVHILYGDYRDTTTRIEEIDEIAGNLAERVERTGENIVLLGDFNILSRTDATFKPLHDHGWTVPLDHLSDIPETKAYDQIAFKIKEGELKRGPSTPNSGAFRIFDSVFPAESWQDYYRIAEATGRPMRSWDATMNWPDNDRQLTREEYFLQWRTWQMSDHLPLWVELEIDFTEDYLKRLLG